MSATTYSAENFPALSVRSVAVVANARTKHADFLRKQKNLVFWLYLFGWVMVLAMLVDIGIGITFNIALISNQREALTHWDHFVRGIAAFAMVGTLMAVVAGVHATFNSRLEAGKRLLAFGVTLVIAAAVFMVASAIGYSQLSAILGQLWHGASAGGDIQLDPTLQGAAPIDPPFMLRLASSALFIGVGFLAALAEVAWLMTRNRLDVVRQYMDQYKTVLDRYASYENNRAAFLKGIEDLKMAKDPEYRHARGVSAVLQKIASYQKAVEASRPRPVNPATVDKAVWDRHVADTGKTDRHLKSAEDLGADTNKLLELVGQFFPKSAPSPSANSTNPNGAAANAVPSSSVTPGLQPA